MHRGRRRGGKVAGAADAGEISMIQNQNHGRRAEEVLPCERRKRGGDGVRI
jgi:hypothetical protein